MIFLSHLKLKLEMWWRRQTPVDGCIDSLVLNDRPFGLKNVLPRGLGQGLVPSQRVLRALVLQKCPLALVEEAHVIFRAFIYSGEIPSTRRG
jgi:hypothetical protein